MSSANQPDSLPGTRAWRAFVAKNGCVNSSTRSCFYRSSFNSSGFAVSQADGTRFRSGGGIDLPRGLKTFIACVIEQPKQFCCADLRKLSGIYTAFTSTKSGWSGLLYDVEVDYRNSRALKLHRQWQPNLAQANNSYLHYLVSLSDAAAFCTGRASAG